MVAVTRDGPPRPPLGGAVTDFTSPITNESAPSIALAMVASLVRSIQRRG